MAGYSSSYPVSQSYFGDSLEGASSGAPVTITMEATPNGPVFMFRDELTGQTRPISEDEANRILSSGQYSQPPATPAPGAGLVKPLLSAGAAYGINSALAPAAAPAATASSGILSGISPAASGFYETPISAAAAGLPAGFLTPAEAGLANAGGAVTAIAPGALGSSTFAMPGAVLGSETLGAALPIASIALGGYGMYNTFKKPQNRQDSAMQAAMSGAAIGAGAGSFIPVIGTGVGAAIGAGIGGLSGLAFGKDMPHPETTDRRMAIEGLRNIGVVDDQRDIRFDGGGSIHLGDPQKESSYQVDLANASPETVLGQTFGGYLPLAAAIAAAQGNGQGQEGSLAFNNPDFQKRMSDMAGMLTQGTMQAQNPLEAARGVYQSFGMGRDAVYQNVARLGQQGVFDKQTTDALLAATDRMYNVRNPNAPAEDQARFDSYQQSLGRTPGQVVKFTGTPKLDLSSLMAAASQPSSAPQAQPSSPSSSSSSKYGAALGQYGVNPNVPGDLVNRSPSPLNPMVQDFMYRHPSPVPMRDLSALAGGASGQQPRINLLERTPLPTSQPVKVEQPQPQPFNPWGLPGAPTDRSSLARMIAGTSAHRTGEDWMNYVGGGRPATVPPQMKK